MIEKNKEKDIIEAARDRFAHFGFSKVTMEEIASDVELGKASLYYYFATKEVLFRSVIENEQNFFVKEIECILEKKIPANEKLKLYVIERLVFFQQLVNLGTLSIHSFVKLNSMFKTLFLNFESKELFLLKKIFEEGKKKKEFRKDTDDKTIEVFLHILHGLRLRELRSMKGNKMEDKSFKKLKTEMLIMTGIFCRGIKG